MSKFLLSPSLCFLTSKVEIICSFRLVVIIERSACQHSATCKGHLMSLSSVLTPRENAPIALLLDFLQLLMKLKIFYMEKLTK